MEVIGGTPVRRRRGVRLADLPVAGKLGLVLLVPLLGLLGLIGVAAAVAADRAGRAGDLRGVTAAAAAAERVTDGLQKERFLAAARSAASGTAATAIPGTAASGDPAPGDTPSGGVATAGPAAGSAGGASTSAAAERDTDAAVARFRGAVTRLAASDPARPSLDRISAGLDGLGPLRARVAGGVSDRLDLFRYDQLAADLIAFRQSVADRPAPAAVRTAARAAGWLAAAREELALCQVAVVHGVATPAHQQAVIAHRATHLDALRRFSADAPPQWRAALDRVPSAAGSAAVDQALLRSEPAPDFIALALAHLDGLRAVAGLVDADLTRLVADVRAARQRIMAGGAVLMLAIVAGSVWLAVAVGRSTSRSLRALRAGALRVAYERLPQTAGALRDADAATAYELAAQQAGMTEIPVAGRDEIGRVAEAFDAVRREAVRAVAEQAALRAGTSAVLVDLARRGRRLADALLERIDAAERDEADPGRLAELFGFDHLATRIRHGNQSLLVLAGADTARAHPRPVPLVDVLRAAQSQILDYARVDFGRVDGDVALAPEAVDGVVHLLAELLDNATRNSPPDRPVLVDGWRTGDGTLIEVADRGPGLDADRLAELNRRLDEPPPLGVADPGCTGLVVVARLAARYGLGVTLRPGRVDGLVAVVRLPGELTHAAEPVPIVPTGARLVLPRPLERSPALPGAEPVDVPARRAAGAVPVIPGPAAGPVVRPDGPTVEAEAEAVRELLSTYQHTFGRFGSARRVSVAEKAADNTEGTSAT
ncbi:sensor histidine kinase [Dactylosporangium roseum]|uniref:histidine kinase n=1 Tax=Dactylosporangium roseum TaxID=47989 RepID=A0ABY5Z977_9ACTN|nr:nitrate- and nitrite sensing domain-containing protein [Dactylosporangium roseum]UWZ38591.1 sensor histidine kinase [Dactylosporangium roseum]